VGVVERRGGTNMAETNETPAWSSSFGSEAQSKDPWDIALAPARSRARATRKRAIVLKANRNCEWL
jgi:hypothetical protein